MKQTDDEFDLHVERRRKLFPSPDEVMDEPATRAEIIGGCVYLAVFIVVLIIDLLS